MGNRKGRMKNPKNQALKRFYVTVRESFCDTFVVMAKDEKEARQIVEDGIPDDYSSAGTGNGYERELRIDPD